MGRWDGRADPRVRRPIRGGRFEPLSRKRSEAVRRVRTATVIMMPLAAMLPPAAAQEPKTLEPVVVTATKLEEPQERLGAAVSVITEDDLKVYNYETVGDALRQIPGAEIQRSGSLGKLTNLRIRGSSTSQVQVLVDGMRVKSPTAGGFDFSDLSEQRAVTGRFGVALPANGHVSVSARYNRTKTDLPVDTTIATSPFFILDPDTRQQTETTILSLQWNQKPVSWYELNVRFGQFWRHLGFQDLFTPADVAAGHFDAFDSHSHITDERREVEQIGRASCRERV